MSKGGNNKTLKDFRHRYMRGLIGLELFQRERHFLKQAAECTSKAIVSLELAEGPVKTVRQAQKLEGIGAELGKKLSQIEGSLTLSASPPAEGMFISSAGALLAAMVICGDQLQQEQHNPEDSVLVPESMLRETACQLCEESMDSEGTESRFCPGWWRLTVLVSRGLVKKRSQNKQPVYELLRHGEEVARRIMAQTGIRKLDDLPAVQPIAENRFHDNQLTALYTNDEGGDGTILIVDTQEWGGDRVGLNLLCDLLDRSKLRYRTQKLPVGDYAWVWQCGRQEILLPVLIERKRVDDLARSLVDGRYTKQKERMMEWKCRVLPDAQDVSLKYVVEGQAEDYVVRCRDGCGAVLKCGYPTVMQIQTVLEELDCNEDFDLIQTENIHGTVNLFKVMTNDLEQRVNRGDFCELLNTNLDIQGTMAGLQKRSNNVEVSKDDGSPPRSPDLPSHGVDVNRNHEKSDISKPSKPRPINLANIPLSQYHSSPALAARTFADSKTSRDEDPLDVPKNQLPVKTAINRRRQKISPSASGDHEGIECGVSRENRRNSPGKKQYKRPTEKQCFQRGNINELECKNNEPIVVVDDHSDTEEHHFDNLELQKTLLEKFNKAKALISCTIVSSDESTSDSFKQNGAYSTKTEPIKQEEDDLDIDSGYIDVDNEDSGDLDHAVDEEFCIFSLSKKSASSNVIAKRKNQGNEKKTGTRKRHKTSDKASKPEPLSYKKVHDNICDIEDDIPDIAVSKSDDLSMFRKRLNLTCSNSHTSHLISDEDEELPDINFACPVQSKNPSKYRDNKDVLDPVPSTSFACMDHHTYDADSAPSSRFEDYSKEVKQVQMVLPSVDVEIIRTKLSTYSGDVDHVINCLLDS